MGRGESGRGLAGVVVIQSANASILEFFHSRSLIGKMILLLFLFEMYSR
jgi:hypothetical protein